MGTVTNKTVLKNVRQRNYLARDFDGFRSVILEYARQYYPDKIQDFSETSVGGLFLDMAAYVGDNMSFYLDHLFRELDPETVIETENIERAIRNAGVKIVGNSASIVSADFYIEVPVLKDGSLKPDPNLLPTIQEGTILLADNQVQFTLIENVNFWIADEAGNISLDPKVVETNGRRLSGTNTVVTKILKKSGLCTSGAQISENFPVSDFVQFRRITLANPNVTQIISVIDGYGNSYYEVDQLTQDVVYKNVLNTTEADALVKDSLKVIPAPYRFVRETSLADRTTTLIFGGGDANDLEDDIIPDPSEFAISLPYSQTFSRSAIDPKKLLKTSTLGTAASNTVLTVNYRYGGGLDNNVLPGSIRNFSTINIVFPQNPSAIEQLQVRNSLEVNNAEAASGGEDAPTADDLLTLAGAVRNSQERIVTKEDMLARIYSMPSNFGRVFRAAVSKNPNNPLAAQIHIISRNAENELVISPDALKINLKRYLNSYRMISDAFDILDAAIINLELSFQIVADPAYNKNVLIKSIIQDLVEQFDVKNMNINQPLIISDVIAIIFSRQGVISVDSVKFTGLNGTIKGLEYSPIAFDVPLNTRNQIIYPPTGAIFEIKYPDINIIGKAVSNV